MKYAIVVFFLVFGLVASELCNRNSADCAHEKCTSPQVPTCDGYVCTCADPPADNSCHSKSDCDGKNYWDGHHCRVEDRHCFDSKCRCRHF